MPTISDSEVKEEVKPQAETSAPAEPELFAAELAMEKNSFNFFPLLLAGALLLLVVGFIYYFISTAREVVSNTEATATINQMLQSRGPAVVKFSSGTVEPIEGQKDPLYTLLSKTGVVVAKPKPKDATSLIVAITDAGENLLSGIDGVQKVKSEHGMKYSVPLAQRRVVAIDKITKLKPHLVQVDYTWQWVPNRLGRQFDATSELVQGFSSYERETLIKSDGVDFYGSAPARASIVLMKVGDEPWQPFHE